MSDTSTLIAIKYKGQMIELPKDSSVSWNDLTDKPTTKIQIGVNIYEDIQGQPVSLYYNQYGNNELDSAITTNISKNFFEFYVNPGSHYYNSTYTDRNGNTLSLTEELKLYLVMYCYENGQYRSKIILYLPYDGVSEPTSEDVLKVLIDSEDIEDVSIYLKNYTTGSGKFNIQMYPTFKGSTTINDLYTQTDTNKSWKVGVLDKVYSEVFDSSVIDAYTKAEADNKFLQSNDISTFITSNDVSNKLEANDVSLFLTANDVSTDQPFHFFTNTTDSTKKGIVIKNGDGWAGNIGHFGLQVGPASLAPGLGAAAFGNQTNASGDFSFTSGTGVKVYNGNEAAFGKYNNSSTGTDTLFTVGNGLNPGSNRHNALEIRLNGDVYIPDTDDTTTSYYYKKPMKRLLDLFALDTSIANNYASKNDISTFITSNDVSIYLTDNDISTFITANDISTKLEANDVSLFITSNDISTFITANDVSIYSTNTYVNSTFAKISYISLSDYDNLQVKDPSTLYIIPS